jgi:hypothetical protein
MNLLGIKIADGRSLGGNLLIARLYKNSTRHAWVLLRFVAWCLVIATSYSVRAGDPVLVLRPGSADFTSALEGIRDELGDECTISEMIVKSDTPVEAFKRTYQQVRPRLIVLMEGKSLNLYRRFQEGNPAGTTYPPSIVFMTSYARQRIKSLVNATGLTYEIQAIQAISNVRELVDRPIVKVGTLYSSNLKEFFKDQQQICKNEQIDLIGVLIPAGRRLERDIKNGLVKLLKEEKVDAIWVINDDNILMKDHLNWSWIPILRKYKVPVVVGVERLAEDSVGMAPFAVVPDHVEMGAQVGGMILSIKEDNWSLENFNIDKPISVHKKYNPNLIPKGLKLKGNVRDDEWEIIASQE